jgi:hypothetical protein
MRTTRRIAVVLLGLVLALGSTTGGAQAVELFDQDSGYGRASVHSWSRGYRYVGVVAEYSGRARITFDVVCANGFERHRSWTDFGPRFRYVQTLPTRPRCNHDAAVRTGGSFITLGIGGWG